MSRKNRLLLELLGKDGSRRDSRQPRSHQMISIARRKERSTGVRSDGSSMDRSPLHGICEVESRKYRIVHRKTQATLKCNVPGTVGESFVYGDVKLSENIASE
jgi:hypothetical protein